MPADKTNISPNLHLENITNYYLNILAKRAKKLPYLL